MSALSKMSSLLGYSDPNAEETYEDSYTEETYDSYEEEAAPYLEESYDSSELSEVAVPDLRRIVTVHPSTYNEARIIGESFRDGVPVIMNLEDMSESDARRMVDFSAGLVFGLHGAIERVTPRVFLLTPATVDVDGGQVPNTAANRFFNQG